MYKCERCGNDRANRVRTIGQYEAMLCPQCANEWHIFCLPELRRFHLTNELHKANMEHEHMPSDAIKASLESIWKLEDELFYMARKFVGERIIRE